MDDDRAVRKVVVRRPPRQRAKPRELRGQRALEGLRRTFARPEETVRTFGHSLAPWRLAAIGLIIVLVLTFSWVRLFHVGPPSVEDLRRAAGVDEWPTLEIGVKNDQPGIAYYDENTKIWSGFDIQIAYMIAEDLGFTREQVLFYGIESEDRARMEATDLIGNPQPVKLVIASYSITPTREAMPNVMFSKSYLHTEQSVLTLAGHRKVTSLEDFKDQTVCSLSSSTSASEVEKAGGTLKRVNRVSECLPMLDSGEVDAISTDAAILGGFKAQNRVKYDHWDLGLDVTEAYGVSVGNNAALRDLVNVTLYRSYADPKDHRWEDAYESTIKPELPLQKNLGVNAAGLPLTPLARPNQPVIERPRVRELPWENLTP
ncbi:transporter substrate-binding domain-containing protein [Symbioplanes lichenis]|uniref:transporter substrate-binding domain-containing protein n=1 Tax=Symbioplanes lichenis TaxID=1629072 RepID=UPI0027389185|nr:transporter substrate-binding domain-containing protein [Actinoplanes lichenis]